MTDMRSYEESGWANRLLGQAYDLIDDALKEYHPEEDIYQDLKIILSKIEEADISLEGRK